MPNERLVDLTIRAARTSDAAALATLMCELGYETSTAEMQKRLERVVRDSRYRAFVAEEQRTIRGMIGTFAYHTFEHDDLSGRILELVVSKRSRRSGIGRRLISAAEGKRTSRKETSGASR